MIANLFFVSTFRFALCEVLVQWQVKKTELSASGNYDPAGLYLPLQAYRLSRNLDVDVKVVTHTYHQLRKKALSHLAKFEGGKLK